MRTHLALGLCVALVWGAGCNRETYSPEYGEAKSLHDRLVMNESDPYLHPDMAQVEALLGKVPEKSLDAAAAQELLAKVRAERARAEQERLARERPAAPPPTLDTFERAAPEELAEMGIADAGPSQPMPGMTVAELRSRFSECFFPGQPLMVAGVGMRETFELNDTPACRSRHPGYEQLVALIENDVIGGFAQKSALRLTLPDGGTPPERPATATPAPAPQAPAAPPPPSPGEGVSVPTPTPGDPGTRDYDGIKY